MLTLKTLKQSILTECAEDHVGLWSVIRDFEEFSPTKDEAAIREQVLNLIRDLLVSKEIQAGYPTPDGQFHPLCEAADKILARIEADWPVGQRPTIGEGVWFAKSLYQG